jgi:hypothetical protein
MVNNLFIWEELQRESDIIIYHNIVLKQQIGPYPINHSFSKAVVHFGTGTLYLGNDAFKLEFTIG